jgi:hypothetical protein
MQSPLAAFVQDCTKIASSLLDDWSDHASKVASKLDEGTYDADSATADLAVTATLATESGLRLAFGWLDALAVLTGGPRGPHQPFPATLPGATLAPAGPFENGHRSDSLPQGVITVHPSVLGPNETEFVLRADATGRRAGVYVGTVRASTAAASEDVTAWIVVP